jgi:hypothetical protein
MMILTDEEIFLIAKQEGQKLALRKNPNIDIDFGRAIEAKIMPRIQQLEAENEALRKDAERWRDLVSHQKFNNKPQVGYAINRAIERIDAARGVK